MYDWKAVRMYIVYTVIIIEFNTIIFYLYGKDHACLTTTEVYIHAHVHTLTHEEIYFV